MVSDQTGPALAPAAACTETEESNNTTCSKRTPTDGNSLLDFIKTTEHSSLLHFQENHFE